MLTEREQLHALVQQWNENRLDLFHLSQPTEDLEIQGVMRFYFQDDGEKVSTKCIRVSSTATTRAVIEALVEKFLPDLKMLSDPDYSLYEVHESGEERRLEEEEKPLLVQLTWHRDDREGRFLLRKEKGHYGHIGALRQHDMQEGEMERNGKRYSKRDKKKELKKKHQIVSVNAGREEPLDRAGSELYRQVPPTTFTRTISNPEVVMKKRREKKLEQKLQNIGHGGSLKVYGGELVPTRPYVTLLVSLKDRASQIVSEAAEKYGLDDPSEFCLVEIADPRSEDQRRSLVDLRQVGAISRERILSDDECPLMELANRARADDVIFAIRRRPQSHYRNSASLHQQNQQAFQLQQSQHSVNGAGDYEEYAHSPASSVREGGGGGGGAADPLLVSSAGHELRVSDGVTEVGSDPRLAHFSANNVLLPPGGGVLGRHCVLAFMDGVVTVTPSTQQALLEVNDRRCEQTVILSDGDTLRIGETNVFRFLANSRSQSANPHSSSSTYARPQSLQPTMRRGQLETTFDVEQASQSTPIYRPAPPPYVPPQPRPLPRWNSMSSITSATLEKLLSGSTRAAPSRPTSIPRPPTQETMDASGLPIALQIGDYRVWDYLVEVVSRGAEEASSSSFRLSPAFSLYLALRSFLAHSKPYLVQFITRIATHVTQIAQESDSREQLLCWLSNSSELSFLVGRDADLGQAGGVAALVAAVERLFRRLVVVLAEPVAAASDVIFEEALSDDDATRDVIGVLDECLRSARQWRLNAALTIQLASQLLHTVNATLFGALIGKSRQAVRVSSSTGRLLLSRLSRVRGWAEQRGLELAAECHLDTAHQAALLLAANKDDVAAMGATCYKLNSLQVRYLLEHFVPSSDAERVSSEAAARVIGLAERQADETTVQDNRELKLEEEQRLGLPFLMPRDGFAAEQLRGAPDGLVQYLFALQEKGLCHSVTLSENSTGWQPLPMPAHSLHTPTTPNEWTAPDKQPPTRHTHQLQPQRPHKLQSNTSLHSVSTVAAGSSEIVRVVLRRGASGGIGLSIVAAQGVGDREVGIYVKKVVDGTPAAVDGRLSAGDQLLSVNGIPLIGISQEQAAGHMGRSGPEVHLEVRKGAALSNGLATWLCQPTPSEQGTPSLSHRVPPAYAIGASTSSIGGSVVGGASMGGASRVPPSPSMSTNSHYQQLPLHTNQQQHQQQNVRYEQRPPPRSSAFVPPPAQQQQPMGQQRHARSASASDLHQESISQQRAMTGSVLGERQQSGHQLPAHYRSTSTRPTVIQPGRPCASPSSLRRAHSPASSIYRPPSVVSLRDPVGVAAPAQPAPTTSMSGYHPHNNATYRASDLSSPLAQSSPREQPGSVGFPERRNSAFVPMQQQPQQQQRSPQHPLPTYQTYESMRSPREPRASEEGQYRLVIEERVVPAAADQLRTADRSADQRTADRSADRSTDHQPQQQQQPSRQTTTFGVMQGAVPTVFAQAGLSSASVLSSVPKPHHQQRSDMDGELRALETATQIVMSRAEVEEELDRLDSSMDLSAEERMRYRQLLDLSTRRTETVIDDVVLDASRSPPSSARENYPVSSPAGAIDARMPAVSPRKQVQFSRDSDEHRRESDDHGPAIVGAQEVYRDPRTRRLNEIQATQTTPTQDGARLGFRDKMRLFATQIGEHTPKDRYKESSAQRQIEHD